MESTDGNDGALALPQDARGSRTAVAGSSRHTVTSTLAVASGLPLLSLVSTVLSITEPVIKREKSERLYVVIKEVLVVADR